MITGDEKGIDMAEEIYYEKYYTICGWTFDGSLQTKVNKILEDDDFIVLGSPVLLPTGQLCQTIVRRSILK